MENDKKWCLKDTGPSYDQKCFCLENPGQNILKKVKSPGNLDRTRKLLRAFLSYIPND